ncbi:hypothetical protein Tco_0448587 [Tanacetum coccineum]
MMTSLPWTRIPSRPRLGCDSSPHKFLMYPRFIQILLNKQQRLLLPYTKTYPTHTLTNKLFSNMRRISKGYLGVVTPLFDTMLVQAQDEAPQTSPSKITSSTSLSPQTHQPSPSPEPIQTTREAEEAASMPHESPLYNVHLLGRDEGSFTLNELTVMCTSLVKRVEGLESELKHTKKTYSSAFTKLVLKVKKLEKQVKSGKARRRARIVQDDLEILKKTSGDTKILVEEEEHTEIVEDLGSGEKGEKEISTAQVPLSTISPEVWDQIQSFIPKDSEVEKDVMKRSGFSLQQTKEQQDSSKQVKEEGVNKQVVRESSKPSEGTRRKTLARKRAGDKQGKRRSKRKKKEKEADDYEQEKEDLRMCLSVIQYEEESMNPEFLSVKYPIVDWEYLLHG